MLVMLVSNLLSPWVTRWLRAVRSSSRSLRQRMRKSCRRVSVSSHQGRWWSDDTGEVDANVEEFITMVAAGLTGTTPHMISASISALSRLIFEFKGMCILIS